MANDTLIKKLVNLREERNYSQSEVAKRLHLESSIISKIESGKRDVKSYELSQFSDLYNVSTDYLLGKTSDKSKNATKELDVEDFVKENGILTYEGMPIPQDDLEVLKRLMQSRKLEKEKDDKE